MASKGESKSRGRARIDATSHFIMETKRSRVLRNSASLCHQGAYRAQVEQTSLISPCGYNHQNVAVTWDSSLCMIRV